MMGRTHLAVGALAGVATAASVAQPWLPLVVAALAGSILPDVDHPHSKLGRRLRPFSYIIFWTFGHRGGTHSLLFALVVAMLASALSPAVGMGLGVGMLSHLLADAISYGSGRRFTFRGAGIPAAWPLTDRKAGWRLVKVNGPLENLLVAPVCVLLALRIGGVPI